MRGRSFHHDYKGRWRMLASWETKVGTLRFRPNETIRAAANRAKKGTLNDLKYIFTSLP